MLDKCYTEGADFFSRNTRATVARSIIETEIEVKQLVFVDFSVSHYIESSVGELEESKLETLLEIKCNEAFNVVKVVGNSEANKVRNIFLIFQKNLYLPR